MRKANSTSWIIFGAGSFLMQISPHPFRLAYIWKVFFSIIKCGHETVILSMASS